MFELLLPNRRVAADEAVRLAVRAESTGWTGIWLSEVLGLDALVTLGAVAQATERVRLGTAIVPVTTRSATVLGMAASTLAQLAPSRFALGIGVSTPALVADRHDRRVDDPVRTASGTCDVVRRLLAGDVVEHPSHPRLRNTRIARPPVPPALLLAALGPRMTQVAYERADGLMLNLLPNEVAAERAAGRPRQDFEVQLLVRTAVDPDEATLYALRKELAGYARVPVYRRALAPYFDLDPLDEAPDLDAAARLVPDEMLNRLAVVGTKEACRSRLRALRDADVTPLVLPVGDAEDILQLATQPVPHPASTKDTP